MRPIAAVALALTARPQPALLSALSGQVIDSTNEYRALAAKLKLRTPVPQLVDGTFGPLLKALEIPIYNEEVVVKYMDRMAAVHARTATHRYHDNHFMGNHAGWLWRPLRVEDRIDLGDLCWGTSLKTDRSETKIIQPSSNYYHKDVSSTYDHAVPFHALQKIDLIEENYKQPVGFVVSDYAPLPERKPDPFLMAVLPTGSRFIIDFWDEPGFGIMDMVK